jgi:hypothetical protein
VRWDGERLADRYAGVMAVRWGGVRWVAVGWGADGHYVNEREHRRGLGWAVLCLTAPQTSLLLLCSCLPLVLLSAPDPSHPSIHQERGFVHPDRLILPAIPFKGPPPSSPTRLPLPYPPKGPPPPSAFPHIEAVVTKYGVLIPPAFARQAVPSSGAGSAHLGPPPLAGPPPKAVPSSAPGLPSSAPAIARQAVPSRAPVRGTDDMEWGGLGWAEQEWYCEVGWENGWPLCWKDGGAVQCCGVGWVAVGWGADDRYVRGEHRGGLGWAGLGWAGLVRNTDPTAFAL